MSNLIVFLVAFLWFTALSSAALAVNYLGEQVPVCLTPSFTEGNASVGGGGESAFYTPRQASKIKGFIEEGDNFYMLLEGESMKPTILDGQLCRVIEARNVSVGDIVAFYSGDRLISHRIIAETPSFFITKGDNNYFADPYAVTSDKIVGKVELQSRGRFWLNLLKSWVNKKIT